MPPPAPNGDTDMFLRVRCARAGDVKGESVAKGHADDIVLSSWHWGLAASSAIGSTRATARRSFKHLTVVKTIDSSSTALMSALATNDEVREAKLSMRKAGESQIDFFTITLGSARVSAIDLDIDESAATRSSGCRSPSPRSRSSTGGSRRAASAARAPPSSTSCWPKSDRACAADAEQHA